MHVVILADFAVANGGAPAVAIESARSLAELSVPVSFIHAVGNDRDPRLSHGNINCIGLGQEDIWNLPTLKAAAFGIWNTTVAKRLRMALKSLPGGPKVIHIHQWTRSYSPSIFSEVLGLGHPVVVTMHDYFLVCPNGVYFRFEHTRPCWVEPLGPRCLVAPCDPRSSFHKAVRVARTAALTRVLKDATIGIIHVSERGRSTIAPHLSSQARQFQLANPVRIDRRPPADPASSKQIAFVGRLTREKGAHILAEAARLADVPTVFIGDGPLADEIRAINPDAHITGWRPMDEVAAMLRNVRAVAAPSLWYETGPLSVFEALSSGIAPVVSNRAGASEKVKHGQTGFVVEPSAVAVAEALHILSDSQTAQIIGATAYDDYWSSPLTPEAHVRGLLDIYQSMINSPAR